MDENSVKLTEAEGVAELVINRPQHMNALNSDVLQSINLLVDKVLKTSKPRVIIITGEGDKAFVAGADIATMADLGPRPIADYVELGQRTMRNLELLDVPVIAAVNGYALGGGLELALACDIIFASTSARFGQPEVNLGIIPGFGGTQRLVQRCGIGAARRLILTGDVIDCDQALKIGLVDQAFEPGQLLTEARNCAQRIIKRGPLAVGCAKRVIRSSQEAVLLAGLRQEVEGFLELFSTGDRAEGMQAFLQKREAQFKGN